MNVESSGNEDDAGTLYPSLMQDSNGNQIKIRYKAGVAWWTGNSSARIDEIEDVKAMWSGGSVHTYKFYWSAETLPHLTSVNRSAGGAWGRQFFYAPNWPLTSPWGGSYGTIHFLSNVRNAVTARDHTFYYTPFSELSQIVYPYGVHCDGSFAISRMRAAGRCARYSTGT